MSAISQAEFVRLTADITKAFGAEAARLSQALIEASKLGVHTLSLRATRSRENPKVQGVVVLMSGAISDDDVRRLALYVQGLSQDSNPGMKVTTIADFDKSPDGEKRGGE